MRQVQLRAVSTPIGFGYFLAERVSGSGAVVADCLIAGTVRTFLADAVNVGKKGELPFGLRKAYSGYRRSRKVEKMEPPMTPPDPYDLDPVRKMDGED